MSLRIRTRYSVNEAADRITRAICEGSFSGELIDRDDRQSSDGAQVCTLMFDKYFMRAGNHAALSVTLDSLSGDTHVFAVCAGTKQGLFTLFDWGTGDSFEEEVRRALE